MILGMTGSRHGITPVQRLWLHTQLEGVTELHHGGCLGADHESHRAALQHEVQVIVHPPIDKKVAMTLRQLLSPRGGVTVLSDKEYHERNRNIVDNVDRMIALPDGPERPNGGTWYTVRYAQTRNVPLLICYPDGVVEPRNTLEQMSDPKRHPWKTNGFPVETCLACGWPEDAHL